MILSITEAAKRVGISRSTIHVHIAKGRLSKSPDGGVDESELLRVYGNFKTPDATPLDSNQTPIDSARQTPIDSVNQTHMDSGNTHTDREVELLLEIIDMLKNQLVDVREKADMQLHDAKTEIERLRKKEDQWMAIFQNRLPAPIGESFAGAINKIKSMIK